MDCTNIFNLYLHNKEAYKKIQEHQKNHNITSILHATGTGKSYLGLSLAYDNKDKATLYVVPTQSIIEHLEGIISNNPLLDLKRDFPHLKLITYQSLVKLSYEDLAKMKIDLLIVDEFHHLAAVWGQKIKDIIESHPNLKVLGMSAYAVRDRGTSYERDMTNPETGEIFSNTVCSRYDICDAIIDGVLPKFLYRSAYVNLEKDLEVIDKLKNNNIKYRDNKELDKVLKDIKKRVHESPVVKAIFQKYIKRNGKYIYFCPVNSISGKSDIHTIMNEVKVWLQEMGLTEEDYEFYYTTGAMKGFGKQNRQAFYKDENLKGESVKNKLRIMFAINQYNEGVHAPGVDGGMMQRDTHSDIVFFEQLGRCLAVCEKNKEEYDELMQKSYEELMKICKDKDLDIKEGTSKKDLVEFALAPIILDFSGNSSFIKQLENNLKNRVKKIKASSSYNKREIHFTDISFDVEMANEDIFQILKNLKSRLSVTWMDYYNLVKTYSKHHDLYDMSYDFKTKDGIHYDEEGLAIGAWFSTQHTLYKQGKLSSMKISLLEDIKACLDDNYRDKRWHQHYNLAKKYYEHYGHCNVPKEFKTKDGVNEDPGGVDLGAWIESQRTAFVQEKQSPEKISLLEAIHVRLKRKNQTETWYQYYHLVKTYYEHYGNCDIRSNFKTKDGIHYDATGFNVGRWFHTQRRLYRQEKLSLERIDLLKILDASLEENYFDKTWYQYYNLVKTYYEHYGDCNISQNFKTKDGIHYDKEGLDVGIWLRVQRSIYRGQRSMPLERIRLLDEIHVNWFPMNMDEKLQKEEITEKNTLKKQRELLNRFNSYLNGISYNDLPSKEEINEGILRYLK